jgi:hypothetical protein
MLLESHHFMLPSSRRMIATFFDLIDLSFRASVNDFLDAPLPHATLEPRRQRFASSTMT